MTLRERIEQERPDYVSEDFVGGVKSCPASFGFETWLERYCKYNTYDCKSCWDRDESEVSGGYVG